MTCLTATIVASAYGQENAIERVIVEADRLPSAESVAPFTIHEVDADALQQAPQLRLDDILRAQVPGFSLFRRSSSRTANPTTQGVTLRNFGPSGASRTLVLLDGIPLNDPFAGYVLWSQVPPDSLSSVLVNPGGGAGLFGNAALAGTIFLTSKKLEETGGAGLASLGNEETYELSINGAVVRHPVALGVYAERFSTDGYPVIAPEQRGRVDTNASSDADVVAARGEWQINRDASLRFQGRWFDDNRNNGTLYTHNDTVGEDASAVWSQNFPELSAELQLNAYGQHRKFRSTFGSVNATRDVETPAQDQFNVPADAAGGSAVWSMAAGAHRLVFGSDARWVEGETNEAFFWNGSQFTRLRRAGGSQLFTGIFSEDTWSLCPNTIVVGGLRFDHWDLFDGFRKETMRDSGAIISDFQFPDRSGNEINGRIGARIEPNESLALRAAFYSGFRVPTLNELYRPFRVGNDVTDANPDLEPEHSLGGEVAVEWQATQTLSVSATGFVNRVEDAVSNVTIGPGSNGGVQRQRQNVDLVIAPGFEATAAWHVISSLQLKGSYLFTHPTIDRAADPALEGKLLAQTPENVFTTGIDWMPTAKWLVSAQVRYTDRQFEDDQNSRVLAPFATVDAAVIYNFSPHGTAALRLENLFDAQIETGKSADGITSIGAPRLVSVQIRWQL